MKRLLIVQASQTAAGQAVLLAKGALAGAQEEQEVETVLMHALVAGVDDLLACHGLLLVTPEKFGYMAGSLKDFFDRTFYPAQGKVVGLPYGLVVVAGDDGSGAVSAVERIARGYPLKAIAEPWIVKGSASAGDIETARQLGQAFAAGLACGIY
jgi:hypothetical protein